MTGEALSPLLTPGWIAHGAEHDSKVPDPTAQVCCRHVNSSVTLGWPCAQAGGQGLSAGIALLPGILPSVPALPVLPSLPWPLTHRELICAEPHGQPHLLLIQGMNKAGYNPC